MCAPAGVTSEQCIILEAHRVRLILVLPTIGVEQVIQLFYATANHNR